MEFIIIIGRIERPTCRFSYYLIQLTQPKPNIFYAKKRKDKESLDENQDILQIQKTQLPVRITE